MMMCVDKKTRHDSLPDREPVQSRARAQARGDGAEHQPDGKAGLATPQEQRRREVLLRVVQISDALNQRLAL